MEPGPEQGSGGGANAPGIIDAHVAETRNSSGALESVTPWDVSDSARPQPKRGLSGFLQLFRGPRTDDDGTWRLFKHRSEQPKLGESSRSRDTSCERLPVRGKLGDNEDLHSDSASHLSDTLTRIASNESSVHTTHLGMNLGDIDDIVDKSRLVPQAPTMSSGDIPSPARSIRRSSAAANLFSERSPPPWDQSVSPKSMAVESAVPTLHVPPVQLSPASGVGSAYDEPVSSSSSPRIKPVTSSWTAPDSWAVLPQAASVDEDAVRMELMRRSSVGSGRPTSIMIYEPAPEERATGTPPPEPERRSNRFFRLAHPRFDALLASELGTFRNDRTVEQRERVPSDARQLFETIESAAPNTPKTPKSTAGHALGWGRQHLPFLRPRRQTESDSERSSMTPTPSIARYSDTEEEELKHFMRVYMEDDSYVVLSCAMETTAVEIVYALGRYAPHGKSNRLFLYERGADRPLAHGERPARILRRRLLQAGYTEDDRLATLGRDDMSYVLRFVFRPDRVTTVNLNALEQQEHTYKHLNLAGMHLTMIPVPAYRYAPSVVSLDLSSNPLSILPNDFVQLCTSLRMLRLSCLALKHLPTNVCDISSLSHIDFSSNQLLDLEHVRLDKLPELKVIRATNNRLSNMPSYTPAMHALEYLNLSNNRLDAFPEVLCQLLTLVDLDLSFNTINTLPAGIGALDRLERLVLIGNRLGRLPPQMRALRALRTLDVRYTGLNALDNVPALPRLERLLASRNHVKSIDADVGPSLVTLDLARNPLSRAHLAAGAASQLHTLDLSYANLATINESLFASVPALTSLVLDHNQFASLPPLGALAHLEHLSCASNALTHLPDSIGSLRTLRCLDVQSNNLRALPMSLWHCENLGALNASSNLLEAFPQPLSDHPLRFSLVQLRLADNRLTGDIFVLMTQFSELEVLNLSMNEIYEVPAGFLSTCSKLRELYLSTNSLSALPADDLASLKHLEVLFVNGNKLQSLPAELGRLKQLRAIDVGNNTLKYNIANWHYDWNWNANPELRYLNISGNQRFEIKPKIAEVNGREKNLADFNRLRHLHLLGLMEVTMTHQPLPDESDRRRVRTTTSHIHAMPYGIADSLGRESLMHLRDLVVPHFRSTDHEALYGLVQGHGSSSSAGAHIARFLAEHCGAVLVNELDRLPEHVAKNVDDPVPTALRRAFLGLDQTYAEHVLRQHAQSKCSGIASEALVAPESQEIFWGWAANATPDTQLWQASACALFVFQRGSHLYVANVGDILAVLSRTNGVARVLGTRHDPLLFDEIQHIRSAEGWLSQRCYVNDKLHVSRAFGHFHLTPVITAQPTVVSIELTDSDEFVILANDELWRYVPYQMAVDIARMDRDNPRFASQRLRDTAIAYGARGSIAVMVVVVAGLFHPHLSADAPVRIAQRSDKGTRRRADMDSTLARLDREVLPPIGHVALVFTDIKTSTLLWETNPGMQAAIRLHNLLLRRLLRSIGGYEAKTEGDAFMVSFQSVSAAILWCFSVQLRLLSVDWPQEILDSPLCQTVYAEDGTLLYRGLSVRMGVHWGWPVCEVDPVNNRMDYFGPMVNRAARISGAADGGQILVSRDVINELEHLFSMYDNRNEVDINDDEAPPPEGTGPRDVVFLRRLGLGIIAMGERRLRGIEVPEFLSLVYPKMLSARYSHLAGARSAGTLLQMYEPTRELLAFGQVKQIGLLCLRLEALSNGSCFPGIDPNRPLGDMGDSDGSHNVWPYAPHSQPPTDRNWLVEKCVLRFPELLILVAREEATDNELVHILAQLVTRIQNAALVIAMEHVRRRLSGPQAYEAVETLISIVRPQHDTDSSEAAIASASVHGAALGAAHGAAAGAAHGRAVYESCLDNQR